LRVFVGAVDNGVGLGEGFFRDPFFIVEVASERLGGIA
jgi:hypothetical protein